MWPSTKLTKINGQALTRDALQGLGLSQTMAGGIGKTEEGEENFEEIQSKLLANSARFAHQRGSNYSNYDRDSSSRELLSDNPMMAMLPWFNGQLNFTPSLSPGAPPCQEE